MFSKNHLFDIAKDTFIALVTGNSKSFSFVPGNGTKTKCVFLIIDQNITALLMVTAISQEPERRSSQTKCLPHSFKKHFSSTYYVTSTILTLIETVFLNVENNYFTVGSEDSILIANIGNSLCPDRVLVASFFLCNSMM